ncbi:MAG: ribosome biogenesis GTPase YlqF [Lachnospiraceae bacterium]|nr:ribosome biogenesis GTPase YlqF [Lachnospiraceae bacterium]
MAYQYYPGHMTKALRNMENDIKLIDLVIEVLDSRAPLSSRNPNIDNLAKGKYRLIVLNKSDLSDPAVNALWKEYFEKNGFGVLEVNSKDSRSLKNFDRTICEVCREKLERDKRRGIRQRPIKAMICGIPNVGKSTFINTVSGKSGAKTGNKPGVTRGNQWISLGSSAELLDTPGILWPKFEDESVGMKLALLGSINDDILDLEELSYSALDFMKKEYPDLLKKRFSDDLDTDMSDDELLREMAVIRNIKAKGNEPDIRRMSLIFMDELRSGKIGRFSLERPLV